MSMYRKLYVALYRLPAFSRLSVPAKLVLIGLLTAPGSISVPGIFEGDASMLAGAVAVDAHDVEQALDELAAIPLIEVDAEHGLVVVTWTDAYADDRPANPSVAKGWAKTLANVIACPARDRHRDRLVALFPELTRHLVPQGVDTVSPKVPSPSTAGVDTLSPFSSSSSSSSSMEKKIAAPAAVPPPTGSASTLLAEADEWADDGRAPAALELVPVGTYDNTPPARARKAAPARALPFRAVDVAVAIAESSAGRFVATTISRGLAITVERAIASGTVTLTQARLAGAWLAAGGDGWRGTLDARHLGDVAAWIGQAEAWDHGGRKAVATGRAIVNDRTKGSNVMDPRSRARMRELLG